jgi:DnaD/phage-associated family protein
MKRTSAADRPISEELKDAESDYSAEWVEGVKLAVEANKRSWRYIRAILERWRKKASARRFRARRTVAGWKRYTTGKFSDFIKH